MKKGILVKIIVLVYYIKTLLSTPPGLQTVVGKYLQMTTDTKLNITAI